MFEQSKLWAFAFVVLILIVIGYCASYLTTVDEANVTLQASKAKLLQINDAYSARAATLQKLENAVESTRSLTKRYKAVEDEWNKVTLDMRNLDAEFKFILLSMTGAVQAERAEGLEKPVGDITLINQKSYREVKILKFNDQSLSILHADGVGAIPIDQLPPSIKERFDLGDIALLPQIQQMQITQSSTNIPSEHRIETNNDTTTNNSPEHRLATLKNKIQSHQKFTEKLESEVKELDNKIKAAKKISAPTHTLQTLRDIAEGNAGMARVELLKLREELQKMERIYTK